MNRSRLNPSALASAGLYLFGLVLVFSPAADFLTSVLPLRPGDFRWRYGAFGLMAGYLHTPLLGGVLMMAVAFGLGHTRMMRVMSGLGVAAALGLLLVMGAFALDMLQVMGMRTEEGKSLVLLGGALQVTKYLTAAGVLGLLGVGGWMTAARGAQASRSQPRTSSSSPVVSAPKPS